MDYKSYIAFIFISLSIVACSPRSEDDRSNVDFEVYDQEQFADILYDLTMVEAAYRLNMANAEAVSKRDEIYQSVLVAHNTDSTVFDENWIYYGARPDEMQEIYDLVVEKIDKERIERGAQPIKKVEDEE